MLRRPAILRPDARRPAARARGALSRFDEPGKRSGLLPDRMFRTRGEIRFARKCSGNAGRAV